MKILVIGIISSLLFQITAYAAGAPVATVSAINQTVEVKQAAAAAFVPATPNMQLYEGDQLRTGTGSMAEITFGGSGSKVRIAAKSQITIESDSNKVSFSFGKLFLAVAKGKSGMKFKTPVAVAAVMGTVGVIEYTPAAESGTPDAYSVTSLDGTFAISDNAGNTKELTVGHIANLTPTGIEVATADILNVVKANSDVMQAAFIKVGLPPQNILSTPKGEVIRLNTSNPDQQVEINTQTNSAEVVDTNHHKGSHAPDIPIIQLPPTIPYISATPLPVILK